MNKNVNLDGEEQGMNSSMMTPKMSEGEKGSPITMKNILAQSK